VITAEPLELDFEKGRYVAKLYNDFETESSKLNNIVTKSIHAVYTYAHFFIPS